MLLNLHAKEDRKKIDEKILVETCNIVAVLFSYFEIVDRSKEVSDILVTEPIKIQKHWCFIILFKANDV